MWNSLRCGINRIKLSSLRSPCIRHYMKTSDKMAVLLKQSDHVPYHCELVYRYTGYKLGGLMYHSVNFMTCVTITTAAYYVYQNGFKTNENTPEIMKMFENPIETAIILVTTAAMFIYASVIRKRYVLRIYYNSKSNMYTVIFTGKIPYTIEQHNFPPASMSRLARESIFPWKNTLYSANGRKIMLFEEYFRTHSDLCHMLEPSEWENLKDDSEE